MVSKINVSIVMANFNGEGYLRTCLSSVLKSSYKNFEVILVDDGSTDKSLEVIGDFIKKSKKINLLKNRKNRGAAASRNKAVKVARGEILVFLDNDTEVDKNWLKELINPFLKDKSVGAVQSLILDFEKRDLIQMAGGLLMPQTGWLLPFHQGEKYSKIKTKLKEEEIVAISASLAVRKDVFERIGGFDEKEAVYTEDLDFCWRVWIAGKKIVLAPKSIVYHWTKPVEKRAHMGANYEKIYFHLAKNSFRSIIKNYELKNLAKYLPVSLLINLGRGFYFFVTKRRRDALIGSTFALLWNIVNLRDTLDKRRLAQKKRKFNDNLLFSRIITRERILEIYKKFYSGRFI